MTQSICRANKHDGQNLQVLLSNNTLPGGVVIVQPALQPDGKAGSVSETYCVYLWLWHNLAVTKFLQLIVHLLGSQGRLCADTHASTNALLTSCLRVSGFAAFLQDQVKRHLQRSLPFLTQYRHQILHSLESSLLFVRTIFFCLKYQK